MADGHLALTLTTASIERWRIDRLRAHHRLEQWIADVWQEVFDVKLAWPSWVLDQHQATASDMPGINRWRNAPGPADSFHWPTKPRTAVKPANPGLLTVAAENHRLGRFK